MYLVHLKLREQIKGYALSNQIIRDYIKVSPNFIFRDDSPKDFWGQQQKSTFSSYL